MSKEIERKYLVSGDGWRGAVGAGTRYRQGYLAADPERSVRARLGGDRSAPEPQQRCKRRSVRARLGGDRAVVTIKGHSRGSERDKFEYPIPSHDAEQILENLCLKPLIVKARYTSKRGLDPVGNRRVRG